MKLTEKIAGNQINWKFVEVHVYIEPITVPPLTLLNLKVENNQKKELKNEQYKSYTKVSESIFG